MKIMNPKENIPAFYLLTLLFFCLLLLSPIFGVVYVNKNATGANNGNSWTDAYTTIQAGINDADIANEEVWVVKGTYYEAIVMKSGVKLYGGFNGTETSRSQRNWTTNITTIDGSTARGGLPAYHTVTMDSITSSTIDGFNITGGNANGPTDSDKAGGGVLCANLNNSNTITNNTISGNSATYGGGILCYQSSPAITNNTISGNSASDGGGIYCYYSSPTITNNTISGNSASDSGGISCDNSSPTITNNTISGNSASNGGGIYCYYSSPAIITNNTISGNSAVDSGGIYCENSSPTITNNTISGNSASNHCGGIFCDNSSPAITNNTITGNSAGDGGGGIYCYKNSSPAITNNTISGNSASGGGGILCENSSPTITNNIISGNSASGAGGISCENSSPIITNNIISGNSASSGGGIYCYYSSPTITNNTISGNSASYICGGIHCNNSSPTIKNTIFYNNNKYDIYEPDFNSDPMVSYNDFYGNPDGVYYDEGLFAYTSVSAMDSSIPECSNNIGLNPLFVGDTLNGGIWTASAVYSSNSFQTTLTNSSASWTTNIHAGRLLNPDTTQNKQFVTVSNTKTMISVWGDATSIAHIGDTYKIFDYHLRSDSPCIDAGCLISGLTEDFEGDPRPINGTIQVRGDGSDYDIGADEYNRSVEVDNWILYK